MLERENRKKRIISILLLFFFFLFYIYIVIFSKSGLIVHKNTIKEIDKLRQEIAELKKENSKYKIEITRLKTDDYIIEKAKKLALIKDDEKVLRFREPQKTNSPSIKSMLSDDNKQDISKKSLVYKYRAIEIFLFIVSITLFLYYFRSIKKKKNDEFFDK